jgi:Fe-S-cluster containining protein
VRTLFEHDRRMLEVVDRVMDDAARRAGPLWRCGPGRTDCCIGPFPINLLDARRLVRGLEQLRARDPVRAAALLRRAEEDARALRGGFPGDPATGVLDEDDERQEHFFTLHERRPCPVLDPTTGRCELYADRPWTCRTYGPPLRVGDEDLPGCPHCFGPCSPERTEAIRVEPDPEGLEDALVDAVERELGVRGETVVALALVGLPRT